MKNILKIFTFLFAIGFVASCSQKDDYEPPYGDFSSLTWWSAPGVSTDDNSEDLIYSETEKTITLNKYIAFKDLSRGVLTHKWTIQEGAKFLNTNFTETDTVYTNFINHNAGSSTSESLAYVIFTQLGISEVHLVNTFKDSVAESINEGGVWKVDKTFTITVTE